MDVFEADEEVAERERGVWAEQVDEGGGRRDRAGIDHELEPSQPVGEVVVGEGKGHVVAEASVGMVVDREEEG